MAKKKKSPKPKVAKSVLSLSKARFSDFFDQGISTLFSRCDNSSIAAFRIFFGIMMAYDVGTYIFNEGWIHSFWIADIHHFHYWPLDFIKPLPGIGMYVVFIAMMAFCIMISLGLFYRVAASLFFLCFTYVFLIEETVYLNHFYLVVLLSFVMIFIPANRSFSLDALIFKKKTGIGFNWHVWLLRFMIGLPYFFGGIAKMKSDWLAGEPLRTWLGRKEDFPIIGAYFKEEWMIYFMSYSGLLLDLLIVPALLYKPTRKWGFLFICLFHLMNAKLFTIAIFPWIMIAATTIFFDPDWFRNWVEKWGPSKWKSISGSHFSTVAYNPKIKYKRLTLILLIIWMSIHCAIPLRHYFIPGNVLWTEEGYYFAWHMMLRDKVGRATFTIESKQNGQRKTIVNEDYLTPFQMKKVYINPKLAWEYAHKIKDIYARLGFDVAVYADIQVSLNSRPFQQFTDPTVDLTAQKNPIFAPVPWIMPLEQ